MDLRILQRTEKESMASGGGVVISIQNSVQSMARFFSPSNALTFPVVYANSVVQNPHYRKFYILDPGHDDSQETKTWRIRGNTLCTYVAMASIFAPCFLFAESSNGNMYGVRLEILM